MCSVQICLIPWQPGNKNGRLPNTTFTATSGSQQAFTTPDPSNDHRDGRRTSTFPFLTPSRGCLKQMARVAT